MKLKSETERKIKRDVWEEVILSLKRKKNELRAMADTGLTLYARAEAEQKSKYARLLLTQIAEAEEYEKIILLLENNNNF